MITPIWASELLKKISGDNYLPIRAYLFHYYNHRYVYNFGMH